MGAGERHLRLGSGDGSDAVEGQAGTDPRALRCRHCHGMVGVTGLAADVLDGGAGNNVLIQD